MHERPQLFSRFFGGEKVFGHPEDARRPLAGG
jgi:hypothetical protein